MISDSTFKIAVASLLLAYILLWLTTPPSLAKRSFTFDLGELVCMALSVAYLFEATKARRGTGHVEMRAMFERNCLLYEIAGIVLKIMSASRFIL